MWRRVKEGLSSNDGTRVRTFASMNARATRVGWFWFRTNFNRRWANYLTIILLVGSIGGLALGFLVSRGAAAGDEAPAE